MCVQLRSMRFAATAACVALLVTATASLRGQSLRTVPTVDGGTSQVLESIFIPPKPHAPFTLTLETEWTRPLANGGRYTFVNKRHIMRDSAGRIYQERWFLVPKNGKVESQMNVIQVSDPAKHTLLNCHVEVHECYLKSYDGSTTTVYTPAKGPTGPLPDGRGFQSHEDLGTSSIDGLDTVGFRESTTLNIGVMGNDQPMVTTRELWFAPQLGISLLSKLDDPMAGKQQFTVSAISTAEPEPSYFRAPEGYTIIDQRGTNPFKDAQ